MKFQKGHKFAKGGARPGSGPKPLKTRELCQVAFTKRIPLLEEIADDRNLEPRDRIAALRALSTVGVPQQLEHEVNLPQDITLKIAGLDAKD